MATETARLEQTSDLQITAGYWVGALSCSPREETTRNPQAREKHKQPPEAPAPTRRATATSRHSRARPESLECGPTSLPRGSWNVMPAATRKLSRTFQVTRSCTGSIARQLLGWSPCARELAGAFVWGKGDPFGMFCTGSKSGRTYAVTT